MHNNHEEEDGSGGTLTDDVRFELAYNLKLQEETRHLESFSAKTVLLRSQVLLAAECQVSFR